MRLVHLSDLHLGFRQYHRQTPSGMNQREADVTATFSRAVDQIIALAPQLVVIGGDVFHTVRPANTAILHAVREFGRLHAALPETVVVIAAGNHDMPRSTESSGILRLLERPDRCIVADREAVHVALPQWECAVLAVPDLPPGTVDLAPNPAVRRNVLVMHGEVPGIVPAGAAADRAAMQIPLAEVTRPGWDYVALGHYHVYRRIADHVYYSGSIDYTSTNPWGELAEERATKLPGKGFIERDLSTGKQTFHPLTPARPVLDLPAIDGRGMSAEGLDAAIQAAIARIPGGIDGKIVRVVGHQVPRHIARALDHRVLRELARRATHLHLDLRRPDLVRPRAALTPGRRPSLDETLRATLLSRALPAGLEREALVALGLRYLEAAEPIEPVQRLVEEET
ncbi:MAG: exonuclease SbcCD subunit D [Gemmatimonadota bacterium]